MSVPAMASYVIGCPATVTLAEVRVSEGRKNCCAGDDALVFFSAAPSVLDGFAGCTFVWRAGGAQIAGADAKRAVMVRAICNFMAKLSQPRFDAASGFAVQLRRSQISTGHSPIPVS